MSGNRRGSLLAVLGGRLSSRRAKAVSILGKPWKPRLLGTLEWLEPRTLLSGGSLADIDSADLKLGYPVAGDDYYTTPVNTTLNVSAPGLLANDDCPNAHSLEALNLYGNLPLEHGMLYMGAWRNDGSFDYVPYTDHVGRDTFTYLCADPDGWLVEATVIIDVGVFNRPPFVLDPMEDVTVDQGAADTVIDLDAVFDDLDIPTGDTLTYNVTVSPPVLPIAEEVTQSSYEYILSNTDPGKSLFTHFGDDRGYYEGTPPPDADHDAARDNIYDHFDSLGLITSLDVIPVIEDITGTYVFDPPLVNVVGVKLGETYPEDVYLVGAHYDSVSNPGADDNASGVAGVMEIARVLSAHTFDCTLVFVAFDGEEQGLFGSFHYVEYHDSDQNFVPDTGTHDGEDNRFVLIDSTASWTNDALIGFTLTNLADGSTGSITANTATTITAVLSGGSENDWDAGDSYRVEFSSEILGMVNLDMIAYNQPGEDHDVVSILDGDGVSNVKPNLVSAISSYSGGVTARDEGSTSLSDHFYFDFFGIDAAMAIESAMGSVTNNPYYHQATDAVDTPGYIDYEYATKITRGVAGYLAQAAKPLGTVDVLAADVAANLLTIDYDPGKSGSAMVTVRATDEDGLFVEDSFSVTINPPTSAVVDRRVFYNNSYFDDPSRGFDDDNAIAIDKTALLAGQIATFANYTGYWRGINGIMVDIRGLADPSAVADGDFSEFVFRHGNDDTPGDWPLAAEPADVDVRDLGGGVHRVTIIWPDNAIEKEWLQVTVLATAQTGLAQPDVFFFGNAVGESGNDPPNAQVNLADFAGSRDHPHGTQDRAAVDDNYDYNRDSLVNAVDLAIARDHGTSSQTALRLIDLTSFTAGTADTTRDGLLNSDDLFDSNAWWGNLSESPSLAPITPPPSPASLLESLDSVLSDDTLWAAEIAWFDALYGTSSESEKEDILEETAVDCDFAVYYDE